MDEADRVWTPESTHDKFVEFEATYKRALLRYEKIICRSLENSEINTTLVKLRCKTQMGVYTKQLDKEYEDPWTQCADLIGARIVVPLASDKARVTAALEKCNDIKVLQIEDKELHRDPKHLKYGGLHIQIECRDFLGPTDQPIQCEVQVRTVAEHTWAETEHEFVYKGPKGLPHSVQRTFARLLALVELVDDELVRGVDDVKNSDMYADHLLVQFVRSTAQQFNIRSSSESMTIGFLHDLLEILGMNARALLTLTDKYVEADPDTIHRIVSTKGATSQGFQVNSDYIAAQPELLPAMALLSENPHDLRTQIEGTHLYEPFRQLAVWTNSRGFLSD
ncbi:GTP pyrophosphokinase [Glutamicibacter nicotianae]|uniref:RelA/SpoT domain-containing protein n=1 Tax=Glutamicibacter nicotianae TaxID=37929 RepID=A0ABQ0RID9_GLUNI|nr:hypothetical protein [Glutamicibacter nicotianae]GEC11578.1 hypothetical protein ANI01nite_07810 [Glutamicibacter nicotianae]